jgi:cytochrome c
MESMKSKAILAVPGLAALAVLFSAQTLSAAPGPDGATLFRQRCQSCHSVDPAKTTPLGPNLSGVVGRKAASTKFNYSPALKQSNVTWNRANLDRFLTGPGRMVPGTRMVVVVSDPTQRAAILDYLGRSGR